MALKHFVFQMFLDGLKGRGLGRGQCVAIHMTHVKKHTKLQFIFNFIEAQTGRKDKDPSAMRKDDAHLLLCICFSCLFLTFVQMYF